MDIQSISRQSLTVPQLVKARTGEARLSLPVDGSLLYTNLKHISGIGSGKNQPAYSMNQLRALDVLIDRLKVLKGGNFKAAEPAGRLDNLQQLIDQYQKTFHDALSSPGLYVPAVGSSAVLLDITV